MSSSTKTTSAPLSFEGPMECALTGKSLLTTPQFNKGPAHTKEERQIFGLDGLLPVQISTLELQVQRTYEQYKHHGSDMDKNIFLNALKEQNHVLFYRLVGEHLKEMMPIIYTPTEAEAIQTFSHHFRAPEGCFLNIGDPDRIEKDLAGWGTADDIDYVIVSDGEEILGIGDQGVGAIGISTAKAALMTLCGGLYPNRILPVVLDVGTDNEDFLKDDMYMGLKHKRVRGKQYDDFLARFVSAVQKLFPNAILHFEDFGLSNARRLLDTYRSQLPCFNDDIQGTGAVTVAAIMAAMIVTKQKLGEQRIVVFGAGTAGTGIADHLVAAMVFEGKEVEEARKQIWLVDKPGLLRKSHGDKLTDGQRPYARPDNEWDDEKSEEGIDLLTTVKKSKATVLIGCSTRPDSFTSDIIKAMSSNTDAPLILPLSNPTKLHEAKPEDINTWSKGKALIATGSPFPSVKRGRGKDGDGDGEEEYEIAEANNAMVYPGIGLGAVLTRTKRISDEMLAAAARALARESPAREDINKALLPDVSTVRHASKKVAMAVVRQAVKEGLSRIRAIPVDDDDALEAWVEKQMWKAEYRPLKKVEWSEARRSAKGELGVGRRG
ncbi:NAD-dependent malic enzyme, mitochondrial [Saitoella coloradoensis]